MTIRDILSCEKSSNTYVQLARYTVVGGVAFAADFGVYTLSIYGLGIHYLLAAALGFIIGLAVNYALSIRWVFADRKFSNNLLEFSLFLGIGLIGMGLTEGLLYILVDVAGADYIAARLITAVLVYLWNFLARKFGLFTSEPPAL